MTLKKSLKINSGLTLVELMIAISLSLILSLAFIQTMQIVKNIYRKQEGLARIQENARSLHYVMGDVIAQAGNIGCNRMTDEMNKIIHDNVDVDSMGFFPIKLMNDSVWVNYIERSYPLSHVIQKKPHWKMGSIMVVSDCRYAEIFSLSEKTNNMHDWLNEYDDSARIGKLKSVLFYVAKTSRLNQHGMPIYALYSKDLNGKTQERIEGVEKLVVEYGLKKEISVKALLNSVEALEKGELLRQWWTWTWEMLGEQ